MDFPEEILQIIYEYSRPLKRISKSKFWLDNPTPLHEMISVVVSKFELYIGSISGYFRVRHFNAGTYDGIKHWCIWAWINGELNLHCIMRFSMNDVMKWNGRTFERRGHDTVWSLTEDSMYTFGVQNNKVVKLIKIKQPIISDKQLFC